MAINKDKLRDYAELKIEIARLQEKADELNNEVLSMMQDNELEEIEINGLGKLSLGSRRKWTYPENISSLEDELKSKKKEAEQVGTASYVENFYCIFKQNKE